MTTSVRNTKISEVKNKKPVVSELVKKTDYNSKMSGIKGKYITSSTYNKLIKEISVARIKQKELVNKSNFSNPLKKIWLYPKFATLVTKAELK